jgi:uncharacterized membrane protein YccC
MLRLAMHPANRAIITFTVTFILGAVLAHFFNWALEDVLKLALGAVVGVAVSVPLLQRAIKKWPPVVPYKPHK